MRLKISAEIGTGEVHGKERTGKLADIPRHWVFPEYTDTASTQAMTFSEERELQQAQYRRENLGDGL